MSENVLKDVDFNEPMIPKKRFNYKEIFLNLLEGDNTVRVVDLKGKKIESHYVKDHFGKQRSVKCPGSGCPCCKADPPVPKQLRIFMKVVDKIGIMRILEFGPQIWTQIKRLVAELKAEDPNALITQRDIIINKGPKGTSPLYNVKLAKVNPNPSPAEQLRAQAINEAVEKDTLDLVEIIKPWPVSRINEIVYGIKDESKTDFQFGENVKPKSSSTVSEEIKKETKVTKNTDDEDLSMFKS